MELDIDCIITLGKKLIDNKDTDMLLEHKFVITPHIFKMLFMYACKHSDQHIVSLFIQIFFDYFNELEQILLRQTFFYSKFHLHKSINKQWYQENVIDMMKTL